MEDIVARMRTEEADLVRKLEAVRNFLAAYGETAAAPTASRAPAGERTPRNAASRIDKFGAYGRAIIDAVLPLLPGSDKLPIRTSVLVEKLTEQGVEISGENKVNALSALLARSSQIKGHGRAGWTLTVPSAPTTAAEIRGGDAQKENEPPSETAGGSDAGTTSAATPYVPFANSSNWHGRA